MKKKQKPQLNEIKDYEREIILPVLIKLLKKKTGSSNRINGQRIVDFFMTKKEQGEMDFPTFNVTRLHKLINYIRSQEILPVCASKNGYWVSRDPQEIIETADSLQGRIDAIEAAIKGMRNQANELRQDVENQRMLREIKILEDDIFYQIDKGEFLGEEPTYKKIERKMGQMGMVKKSVS